MTHIGVRAKRIVRAREVNAPPPVAVDDKHSTCGSRTPWTGLADVQKRESLRLEPKAFVLLDDPSRIFGLSSIDERTMQDLSITPKWYPPGEYAPRVTPEIRACMPPGGLVKEYVDFAVQMAPWAQPIMHLAAGLVWATAQAAAAGLGQNTKLWILLLAPPGSGKGSAITVLRRVNKYIRDLELAPISPTQEALPTFMTPPEVLRVEAGHTSPEGLFHEIEHADEQSTRQRKYSVGCLVSDEFSGIFTGHQRIDWSVSLVNIWDGHGIRPTTRTAQRESKKSTDTVDPMAVSAFFTSAAEPMQDVLTSRMVSGGLFSRFLVLRGLLRKRSRRAVPKLDPTAPFLEAVAHRRNTWAYEMSQTRGDIRSSDEAEALLDKYFPEGDEEHVDDSLYQDAIARLPILGTQIAEIYSFTDKPLRRIGDLTYLDLREEHVKAAANLIALSQSDALTNLGKTIGVDKSERAAHKIIDTLRESGKTLSRRDLQHISRLRGQAFEAVIADLIANAEIEAVQLAKVGGKNRIGYKFIPDTGEPIIDTSVS